MMSKEPEHSVMYLFGLKHGCTFAAVTVTSIHAIMERVSAVPASSNSDSNSDLFSQEITRIKMLKTTFPLSLKNRTNPVPL